MIDVTSEDLQQIEGGNGYTKDFWGGVFVGYEIGAISMVLVALFL